MEGTIRGIADELLDTVASIERAEVRKIHLVADLVDASGAVAPQMVTGSEQMVDSGADGAPQFAEFLIVEVAAMLKVGEASAWALIRDAMNLRHRHHSRGLRPQQPPKEQPPPPMGHDGPLRGAGLAGPQDRRPLCWSPAEP